MVNKRKLFYKYQSSEIFALLQKSYIWKFNFCHLKTFFYYMVNKSKVFYNYQVAKMLHFYWILTYESWLFILYG